jgi:hypothetical protein
VQSRVPQHRPVVTFERYDALAIFDEVLLGLDSEIRDVQEAQWRERVKARPTSLANALESWLASPLDATPILLIIDDLERILEPPSQSDAPTGVLAAYRDPLKAVLLAFDRASTQSRLLLTSRYEFRLPDGAGGDLAASLVRVPLKPMAARERIKQWRAAERSTGRETAELDKAGDALLSRALATAAGNPGLQAILTRPILAREFAAAEEALRLPLRDQRSPRKIPVLRLGRRGNPLLDRRLQDDPEPRPLFRASQGGRREAEGRCDRLRRRAGDRVARR